MRIVGSFVEGWLFVVDFEYGSYLLVCDVWFDCRSFQVGREKFLVPWLFLINRKSTEVPMIEMNLVRIWMHDCYLAFRMEIVLFPVEYCDCLYISWVCNVVPS